MTRTPPRPSSDLRAPSQLRRELAKLHAWAGSPGARKLAATAAGLDLSLARSTTHDLISGTRMAGLPSRDFIHAFVMACLTHSGIPAADAESGAEIWDQAWLTVVQAHGQLPATPVVARTGARRPAANPSLHRMVLLGSAAIGLVAAAALTLFLATDSDDPPTASSDPTASTVGIQDIYCAHDSLTASWQNHHSQLYLAVPDARDGKTVEVLAVPQPSAATTFAVARYQSPEIDGCAHQLASGTLCLEASSDAKVVEAECANRSTQLWVIENHWYNEGVMWQRLRPAYRIDLCLQQQADEKSSSAQAVLKPCNTNWIQQWQLQ